DGVLENDLLRVAVDARSGCVTSLYDKRSKSELVPPGACGAALEAFAEQASAGDALAVDADHDEVPLAFEDKVEVRVVESGPLRAALEVVRRLGASRVTQHLALAAGAGRVDVVTDADWRERRVALAVAFPTTVVSDAATYEVPYGTIDRPTAHKPDARAG